MSEHRKLRVGLALGSGAARGWAHIGVIRALEEAGIRPDLVCGTSIGAMVAAFYAAGELDRFEQWALGLEIKDVVSLMDVSLRSGLLKGRRLMDLGRRNFADRPIEELPMPFGAVATCLRSGAEIWLRNGSTLEAVRASIALPGLLAPAIHDGDLLVDGGLVNPVPVSLARAMGADVVIAVDLNSDLIGRHLRAGQRRGRLAGAIGDWIRKLQDRLGLPVTQHQDDQPAIPSLYEVVATSLNIMQVSITRSRIASEPPDVSVTPHLAHLHMLDFHRAKESIDEGRRAVERASHELALLKQAR